MNPLLSRLLFAICIVLIPSAVALFILQATLQHDFTQLKPFWSDEIYYTQQARAFREAQLNSGYFTVSEETPRLNYAHYYVWSPFVPMLYASLGVSETISIQQVNASVLSVAIAISLYVMRRAKWRDWLLYGAILAVFPALILLYPFHMQDMLHLAIALIVACGIAQLLNEQTHFPRWIWFFVGFLCVAMLLRPTWGLLVLPVLCLADKRLTWGRFMGWGVLSAGLILPIAVFFQWSSAPYPHFRSEFFETSRSLGDTISGLLDYFITSVGLLFTSGNPTAHIQRLQIVGLLLGIVGIPIGLRVRSSQKNIDWRDVSFHVFNLLAVYIAVIGLHEVVDGRDYRVMAPHLLLSVVVCVWRGRWGLITLFLASVLVFSGQITQQYREDVAPLTRVGDSTYGVENLVQYDPQKSAWCNTLSFSFYYVIDFTANADMLLAFDAGLGLSWINPQNIPQTFNAGYLMLTNDDLETWGNTLNIEKIADVQQGSLYKNLDARCER